MRTRRGGRGEPQRPDRRYVGVMPFLGGVCLYASCRRLVVGGGLRVADAELIVESGRLKGQRFRIEEGQVVAVGRSIRSDIQIPDQGVSRLHCRLTNTEEGPQLIDLGSSNGTLVNGVPAQTVGLREGDRIGIGSSVLRLTLVQEPLAGGHAGPRKLPDTTVDLVGEQLGQPAVKKQYDTRGATITPDKTDSPQLARARRRLAIICEMGNTIYAEVNMDAILDAAAEAILAISGAERSAIVLINQETGEPEPVATHTLDCQADPGAFPLSRTILDEALRQGVSLISSNAADDDRFKAGVSVVMQNIHGVMCVPLRTDEKIIGAIYVDSRSGTTQFTEAELSLLAAVGHQVGVAIERARLIEDLETLFIGAMHTLVATIEAKDPYTRGHSERVTAYALMLARELKLSGPERYAIELAGVLHDVGKIGVPEAVLQKPGRLNDEEFASIRRHPDEGVRIIENMPEIDRIVHMGDIVESVRHHHERFDGTGYPSGLAGTEIPLSARILAVADTFDAMTSDRPYRAARDPREAMETIAECAGTQFDPAVAKAFQAVYGRGDTARPEAVGGRFRITRALSAVPEENAN